MYAQIAIVVLIIPVATVKMTQWYSKRCAENSKKIVNEKLLHFQSIANTYTEGAAEDDRGFGGGDGGAQVPGPKLKSK